MARLEDITGKAISGEWGLDDEDATGIPVLRTTNFTNDGVINFSNVVTRTITKKDLSSKYLRPGDIIIEKSGGSDKQPVGRVVYYEEEPNRYLFNNFTGVLRIMNPNLWNSKYVFYALYANYLRGGTRKYQNKTTGLHNLKTEQYVREFELRECSIQEQCQIVFILDKLSEVISLRKEQLTKLDELVKARFVEMFGNITETVPLSYYISALSAGKSLAGEKECTNKVLKTGAATYDEFDPTQIKNLPTDYIPQADHLLKTGDIIISRMNTLELVGATAYVWEAPQNTYLPDRLWRAEINKNTCPVFVWQLLIQDSSKEEIRKIASGTSGSMKNISKPGLLGIRVKKVEFEIQQKFSIFVEQIHRQKLTTQQSLDKLEILKKTLMQEYFG